MTNKNFSKLGLWLVIIILIIIDQISKLSISQNLEYGGRISIIPNHFDLTLVYNTGAAFSFLADAGGWQKYFFLSLAVIICLFLIRSIKKGDFGNIGKLGAIMVIGGAIGNVIDRLVYGHVIDFLLFYWNDWFYPAFNAADSFICIGVVFLVVDSFKKKRQNSKKI